MRVLIAIALSLLSVTAEPVAAQTREERLDAVQEFKRFFRKFKTVEEQVEAVRTLEGMECVEACDELYGLLDHKTPEIARTARAVMSSYREPETFAGFVAQLPDLKDQDKRAALIEIFGVAGQRDAMPEAVRISLEDKKANDDVRYATLRAVTTCGFREGVPALVRALLGSSNPLIRMAAAETAGGLRLADNGPDLIPLLEDSSWQVQIAAIQGLASIRVQDAVSPLIELMDDGGRASEECADALFRITALDLPVDASVWRTTWERLSSIDGWRIPTDEELAKKAANRKKYDALYGAKSDEATTFGGIPTSSTRILFIIDVSGSMADFVVERENFDAGYEDFEKLTIVKTELMRTIESLGEDVLFNIVAFASELDTWKKGMVRANNVNRASAQAFVRKLEPIGGPEAQALAAAGLGGTANLAAGKTNTFKALMYPFGVDPDAKRPSTGEEGAMANPIDTVFFLSDGRPSTGKHTDTQTILDEVKRLNELYRMVFHTIAIGEFQKEFLRSLAEANDGVFVDLGR
jgi:hypothetical protein